METHPVCFRVASFLPRSLQKTSHQMNLEPPTLAEPSLESPAVVLWVCRMVLPNFIHFVKGLSVPICIQDLLRGQGP